MLEMHNMHKMLKILEKKKKCFSVNNDENA